MAGAWHLTVVVLLALGCSAVLVSSQPHDGDLAASYVRDAERRVAAKDPTRGVSVSGCYPEAVGPPIAPGGPLKWYLGHKDMQIPYYVGEASGPVSPAGKAALAALMEQQPRYTVQQYMDMRIYQCLHNDDGTQKYKEVGPMMFNNDPATGKVVECGRCWRMPSVATGNRPQIGYHDFTTGKTPTRCTTELARFYLVADPETRQHMIDLLAQGKEPEASHLCGHPWCANYDHDVCETRAANRDRQWLCSQLQVLTGAEDQPFINPCCHIECQCLAALPDSVNIGNI